MNPLGQISAGGRLTAAGAQAVAPLSAYKATSQSATSTTLASDSALLVPLQANAVYHFELVIGYEGSSSTVKLAWAAPSGSTMAYSVYGDSGGSATAAPWETASATVTLTSPGASTPAGAVLSGTVSTSGTAGNLQLQWAPGSSSGVTVLAGSVLTAWQVQ